MPPGLRKPRSTVCANTRVNAPLAASKPSTAWLCCPATSSSAPDAAAANQSPTTAATRCIRADASDRVILPSVQHGAAEGADHGQPLEPGRRVGARWIARLALARVAAWDLIELAGAAVVFPSGHAQIVVHGDVDRAHAEARQLGRGGLRRGDPDVARPGHEQILDAPVAREDPEAAHPPARERAREARPPGLAPRGSGGADAPGAPRGGGAPARGG